jgi:hypothetical protein
MVTIKVYRKTFTITSNLGLNLAPLLDGAKSTTKVGGKMTIRVLIADDHSVVRQGLQMFLALDEELEVVGEAANGVEALELTQPGCCFDGYSDASDGRHCRHPGHSPGVA